MCGERRDSEIKLAQRVLSRLQKRCAGSGRNAVNAQSISIALTGAAAAGETIEAHIVS
jgi:hypothetical protein